MITTLAELIKSHPEWADLPTVVYCKDGHYDYIGEAGMVYPATDEDTESEVLVFAPN